MTAKKKNAKKAAKKASSRQSKHPYADAPINKALSKEQKLELYTEMVRIRRFEERTLRAYQQGKIGGFLHLYIGQEAIAVATCSLTQANPNDHCITAYRDHGHALASGMNMNECMAELYGKATGCSKGKGGSMHFFAPDKRYWGGHGIVGGQAPLGAGLAFALKYNNLSGVCLCFMGDGAVNQGAVHESFNLASLWDLPVVYIIENNGYSMGTSEKRSSAHPGKLLQRADAYNMESHFVEGNDVYAVRAVANEAMESARKTNRPQLIEIATYRYRGHSVADANAEKYRTKSEIEDYIQNKDPISLYKKQLISEKVLNDKLIEAIDKAAREEAEASAKYADESPYPDNPEAILQDVFWSEDNKDKHSLEEYGQIFF